MSDEKKAPVRSRAAPQQKRTASAAMVCPSVWQTLCADGYRPLSSCPEVRMCLGIYADLIGSMTIHLMRNTGHGDERVVNELSRKIDINPNHDMVRQTFMSLIVWSLMLGGNQVTIPRYTGKGLLGDLLPVPPSRVGFEPDGESYLVRYGGLTMRPDEVLHFVLRPDPERHYMGTGFTVGLRDVVDSLRQAETTRNAILSSPMPSIIVKVDGLTDEFSSNEGRKKLRKQYIDSSDNGEPWFIPAEAFSVEQVKPLTLNDLAIKTNMELDKRSIAALLRVPSFLVGIGPFNREEFNWFVSSGVMPVAKPIEQEMTKKLLYSPDLYWRFNRRSLLSYNIEELVSAGSAMVDRMALRRNEWRDWLGLPPDGDMEELLALENYIPANRLGDQGKLKGGPDNAGQKD